MSVEGVAIKGAFQWMRGRLRTRCLLRCRWADSIFAALHYISSLRVKAAPRFNQSLGGRDPVSAYARLCDTGDFHLDLITADKA